MSKRLLGFILAVCVVAFFAGNASADDYHYTNLLIGDRASGMGGAYTAVSDDATGLYYNPAGIMYTSGRSLSASVNAYYDNEKTYKGVIGGNGWTRRSSSLLPNYFGVVQPMGRFKFGFSYAVPDSIMEDQSQTFNNLSLGTSPDGTSLQSLNPGVRISSYIINFNHENNVYNIGPSIATELSDNFSAGLTLYYYQRKELTIMKQLIQTTNGGFEETNLNIHMNEKGYRPILGFMWSPVKNVSVGLSLSKVFLDSSDKSTQYSYVRQNISFGPQPGDNPNEVNLPPGGPANPSGDTSAKRTTPKQISLGVAWFPSASFLLTTDLSYYSAKSVEHIVTLTGHSDAGIEDVLNIAIGTEYFLARTWAVRAGFFTDLANTPTLQSGVSNQDEHIDLYGGTLSISNFTRNTSVTLGGGLTYGTGKSQIVNGANIQDAESQGWMVFLSSSYSY